MTIEQLLDCDVSELEKLSDAELEKILAPHFNVTRPEFAGVKKTSSPAKGAKTSADWEKMEKKKKALELAAQIGLHLK